MKYLFFVFLLAFIPVAKAQITDSTVIVTTKTDIVYEGKIIEEVKDRYIRLQEKNGNISRFAFNMISTIRNKKGDILFKAAEQVVSSPYAKQADNSPPDSKFYNVGEYKWWRKGMAIDSTDTTYVRIGFDAEFGAKPIKVRYRNGDEGKIKPDAVTEFLVYKNGEPVKYLSVMVTAYGQVKPHARLCRLVLDGECQLFFYEEKEMTGGAPGMAFGAGGGFGMAGGGGGSVTYYIQYIARYKGKVYNVAEKYDETPKKDNANDFNTKYQEIFAECPSLIQKYDEKKKYTLNDVLTTVKEFNACIAHK